MERGYNKIVFNFLVEVNGVQVDGRTRRGQIRIGACMRGVPSTDRLDAVVLVGDIWGG